MMCICICFYLRRGSTYYRINNLDTRISNPDQVLTQDAELFCNGVTELYSNMAKVK